MNISSKRSTLGKKQSKHTNIPYASSKKYKWPHSKYHMALIPQIQCYDIDKLDTPKIRCYKCGGLVKHHLEGAMRPKWGYTQATMEPLTLHVISSIEAT